MSGGRSIHVEIRGDGPLLLLLHPVGLDGSFWGQLPEKLAASHRVVAVDLPGHGRSPDVARPGRMDSHVDEIARLIGMLGGGPATLLGVSFGGMISQHVALAHPDLVDGLVLCACPGEIPHGAREAILQRGRDAEAGGMDAVLGTTIERWFTPGFVAAAEVEPVRRRLSANDPSNWAAAWEAVSGHDALLRLGQIDVPALVIAGDSDAATPLEAKRALAAAIPGARLDVLAGAPHMMQIETAELFGAAVGAFLAARGEAR